MPNDQQLRYNTVLIQPEGSIADGGDDTNVLSARLVSANIIRDVAGAQERIDPWRTREFTEVKHQGWSVQLFGELRAGGFLPWIVQAIATAGTAERGLSVYELLPANTDPATFAMQFQGIEGTSTFLGLKAKRINLTMVAGGVITYALEFAGLQRIDTEGDWTSTGTEAGELLTASTAQLAMAGDIAADPDSNTVTGYDAAIEISRDELEAADFSADGIPQGHTTAGAWDVTGKIMMPETAGITDEALNSTWNGELNLRSGTAAGETFEIEAGIVGSVTRRRGHADDWKQATIDFVSRRASAAAIVRFLTDQPTLT